MRSSPPAADYTRRECDAKRSRSGATHECLAPKSSRINSGRPTSALIALARTPVYPLAGSRAGCLKGTANTRCVDCRWHDGRDRRGELVQMRTVTCSSHLQMDTVTSKGALSPAVVTCSWTQSPANAHYHLQEAPANLQSHLQVSPANSRRHLQ